MQLESLEGLASWDEPAGESLEDMLIEQEECLDDMLDHELVAQWSEESADSSVGADKPAVQSNNRFISKL